MYELVQINDNNYYINSLAKIGIYVKENLDAYLIDSGNDKDAGRKVKKILEEKGWKLKGILNTHSNADHIGGNQYLQNQTGCKIFSEGIEAAITENTVLEPSFLYGGFPFKDLRHKFLMAKDSKVTPFSDKEFPKDFKIVPLPGHFFDMVGYITPDNVFYMADCLSGREILEKYKIVFIYDVGSYVETLEKVKTIKADVYVPSHAEVGSNIEELAQYNIDKVYEVAEDILNICKEKIVFEEILQRLFIDYGLKMNYEQYVLVGSTVRSYLSWLKDSGKVNAVFENSKMYWETVKECAK